MGQLDINETVYVKLKFMNIFKNHQTSISKHRGLTDV